MAEQYAALNAEFAAKLVPEAEKFSPVVAEGSRLWVQAMNACQKVCADASTMPQPNKVDDELQKMVQPVKDAILAIKELEGKNKLDACNLHLRFLVEASGALVWPLAPIGGTTTNMFVGSMREAADMWGTKLFNSGNAEWKPWRLAAMNYMKELVVLCKDVYPNGVIWKDSKAAPGHQGLLGGISEGATAGLRKVQDSEKTKNRDPATTTSTVPSAGGAGAGGVTRKSWADKAKKIGEPKGAPKKVLERDVNWIVENYDPNNEPSRAVKLGDECTLKHNVYISNSNNITFSIDSKAKAVFVDNCDKICVVLSDVLSSVEVVNSTKLIIHCRGSLHTLQLDKVDGCDIYSHGPKSEGVKIVHAVSQNLNFNANLGTPEDVDFKEMPVPTQFVCTFDGKKLKTDVSDIYSG
ncbi:unnamed protein product [Amoebophrya sp. A25]|nr:unnamed protein product [Amoebophrya sp. A25]|eukprot:GSA25T00026753001.1